MKNKELNINYIRSAAFVGGKLFVCADIDEEGKLLPGPEFVPANNEHLTQIAIPGMDGLYVAIKDFNRTEMKTFAACGVNSFEGVIRAAAKLGKLLGISDGTEYIPESAEEILKEVL